MKFKFDKNLGYQQDAISSIVDIFDTGENMVKTESPFKLMTFDNVFGNDLKVDGTRILANVKNIQKRNNVDSIENLYTEDFSIEMETGTGKTYVYLRTMFELNKKYGLKKFIILVPSVAIREGVLKTLEQTEDHFKDLYNVGYGYFAYDSKKLSRVREFSQSLDIQIMVMTIQSFNSDNNIMRQTPDRFNGESPLNLIAQTKPIVIMDEPQNMESELSKSAISDLSALFRLRYSATHKKKHNLVYILSPVDAYRNRLVKKIEVFGVKENESNDFIFDVLDIRIQKGKSPEAKIKVEVKNNDEYINKVFWFRAGEDLKRKTKNNKYENIFISEVDAKDNFVELSNSDVYKLQDKKNENKKAIFRTQIRETIKSHFKKQEELGENIKVLSLFFIDKVANYTGEDGVIRQIFVEEFEKLKDKFNFFKKSDVKKVHNGYFANVKKKGEIEYKDTTGKTLADKEVYDLIMKDKEKLLSFEEPTSFIFSHSALKEGWDNPNIFQICTLNETTSAMKKRQEIGRGMRLAVDINGDRVFDRGINILTVVANESYEDFVGNLQKEYTAAGYKDAPQTDNVRKRVDIKFKYDKLALPEDFKQLWDKIKKKTKFNIELHKKDLVKNSVEKICEQLSINNLVVRVEKVIVDFKKGGELKTIYQSESVGEKLDKKIVFDNFVERVARETSLTKKTILDILEKVDNFDLIFENPEEYIRGVILIIKNSLNELLINSGLKYFPVSDVWEISLFDDFMGYKNKTIKSEKSIYDRVLFDSEGERQFAESLEGSERVKLFTKLPARFVVDTPLGTYNPDWAIVMDSEEGEKLYLVRETKFGMDLGNLRPSEQQKIKCGQKHFEAIDVDFKVSQSVELKDLH